jgi:hypothetical protein
MINVNFDPKVDIEKTTEILKEIARDKMGGWFDLPRKFDMGELMRVKEAAKKNGETIPAKPRGQVGEYTFFVDGERTVKMMDDLRKNHEAKINEFLSGTKKYDGVMIVAPFIGGLLEMEELRARDLQLTDLEFAFTPYYNSAASAVRRMSEKLESAEAKMLYSLLIGLQKKYPRS